ncbi:DUF4132 domain-containing protein [Nonomuraea fuscirosea]|uniref:DUF4132 domain-containing protein n=1 Tax=Nonomuraea fuscirosea TaxID=1291556 RepID=UPI00340D553E
MTASLTLSPEAQRVLPHLTGRDLAYPAPWPDGSRLTARDLGHLLPLAYRTPGRGSAAFSMRCLVEDEVRQRQPEFTPASCLALYEALVDGLEKRKWADLSLAAGALLRCPDGVPAAELAGPARVLIEFMIAKGRLESPWALLSVAAVAGMEEVTIMPEEPTTSLAAAERDLVLSFGPAGRALLAETGPGSYGAPPESPETWERLAELPAYMAFARSALDSAGERLTAIHAGELPFHADKAFTRAEVATLGRAARLALFRDEPWLPDSLGTLLSLVAVAPTQAKTPPSQALLFEIARAAERFPTPEVIAALRAARTATRHAGVVKQLDRMIKRAEPGLADRVEVALRMPSLGFGPGGRMEVTLGAHQAVIAPGSSGEFALTWRQGERPVKSVPAAVRKEHPEEVKRLRELVKQVNRQVGTMTRALEAGFAADSTLPYATWLAQVARHPVAASVAARLIWEIGHAPGEWRATLGAPEEPGLPGDAPVRLWHPARATTDEVFRWRERITEERIRQPFKQAFREVYLLTPAEEGTTRSERFAGHIVDYRRLYALFRTRAWQTPMLGPWDGGGDGEATRTISTRGSRDAREPTRPLSTRNGGDAGETTGTPSSGDGGEGTRAAADRWRVALHHDYLHDEPGEYALTGRIRFDRRDGGGWREVPPAEVPPLVFSEAMRDVDLFVAVTSIATDPEWAERGQGRHLDYWRETSFGTLAASGEVRRDALARILPRLAVADRCTLDGRFLVVRGDLRTYKIHLGSGNVLMDPGDVYLCVVPGRKTDARLFLPFEDDSRLALILSKALLLARDTEITDESILRQIKG